MRNRLLVSDIDGTLLPLDQAEITPEVETFLRELHQHNCLVTFATGKPFVRALVHAERLNLSLPLICCNGALIRHPQTKEVLFNQPLPAAVMPALMELAKDPANQLYFEINDQMYAVHNPEIPPEQWRHVRKDWRTVVQDFDPSQDMQEVFGAYPNKITIDTDPARVPMLRAQLQERFGNLVNLFSPKKELIDVMDCRVTKGTAVQFLAKYLEIPLEEVIVVGDELNDLSMFEIAGTALAIEGAPAALVAAADQIISAEPAQFIATIEGLL